MASAVTGLPAGRRLLPGLPVSQARPAQATPEASIAGRGLPRSMRILIEKLQALMAAKRT